MTVLSSSTTWRSSSATRAASWLLCGRVIADGAPEAAPAPPTRHYVTGELLADRRRRCSRFDRCTSPSIRSPCPPLSRSAAAAGRPRRPQRRRQDDADADLMGHSRRRARRRLRRPRSARVAAHARQPRIGYMPEDRGLVPELTVEENILVPLWSTAPVTADRLASSTASAGAGRDARRRALLLSRRPASSSRWRARSPQERGAPSTSRSRRRAGTPRNACRRHRLAKGSEVSVLMAQSDQPRAASSTPSS